ncbi:DUF3298 and DUF4163 domain-containing protein [Bradyrhizobium sp. LMTR 3]|uniref:DUF3298 and DUF4163 domain-containing protein n=1 Tax=Bradyrhizobium sp. LMTR 3 TaxID=189873 RepID=UPI000810B03F|nr:DUF3298 and DUF4163 domain-containing protein [Bradyrhizobium sp. LMTR 3]OCK61240.1 hypothetical protein LMTR3_23795 [Bradyrhizobium sp. LMTR 3]
MTFPKGLRGAFSIVGLLGSLSISATLAAEPKPEFSIKTKWLKASVFLDATIKADAALAANCLAEGKAWAQKNRADADKERKQDPGLFRNAWSYERKYQTRSVVDGRYVSIIRADYEYTGGAHPNSSSDTILWDKSAGKRISIRPFFTESADNGPTLKAMRQGVIASLTAEKKKRGAEGTDTSAIEGIEPKLLKIGPVALAPSTEEGKSSGLNFYYAPYAVGSYAEGEYVAFVPWETLKPYLTPEGARIFGGARPKEDEDRPH